MRAHPWLRPLGSASPIVPRHRADRQAHPFLGADFGERARCRRRYLDVDFIGFELDDRFVEGHRFTRGALAIWLRSRQ